MAAPGGSKGRPTGSYEGARRSASIEAFRILDWTKLDAPPSMVDVKRLTDLGGGSGNVRLAILVDTPRKLRAATVFAEQASTQGAQVRVFTDAKEALAWLYRDVEGLIQPV